MFRIKNNDIKMTQIVTFRKNCYAQSTKTWKQKNALNSNFRDQSLSLLLVNLCNITCSVIISPQLTADLLLLKFHHLPKQQPFHQLDTFKKMLAILNFIYRASRIFLLIECQSNLCEKRCKKKCFAKRNVSRLRFLVNN